LDYQIVKVVISLAWVKRGSNMPVTSNAKLKAMIKDEEHGIKEYEKILEDEREHLKILKKKLRDSK